MGRCAAWGRRRRRRSRCGRFCGQVVRDCRGEAVAAAGNRRDRVATEEPAELADLHRQVVLLHDHPGPCGVEQLALGDDPLAPFDQRRQHVERPRPDGKARAVLQQASTLRPKLERSEANHAVVPGSTDHLLRTSGLGPAFQDANGSSTRHAAHSTTAPSMKARSLRAASPPSPAPSARARLADRELRLSACRDRHVVVASTTLTDMALSISDP